ncbi:hypothetical protein OYC64_013037 [Pagothenia borchgrevinki]|uniref:Uncharacterized protein n=1 Tax=Pagothenia borchgrevinki TaxID=8213 RepID=A0ABD2FTE1_PAGBO
MRWVPEQGELGCSLHYHTSDCPALFSLYFSAAQGAAMVLLLPSERPWLEGVLRLCAVDVTAIFQAMVQLLALLTASC